MYFDNVASLVWFFFLVYNYNDTCTCIIKPYIKGGMVIV